MEINQELSAFLVQIAPDVYRPFLTPDGKLLVILNKVLYGCIESARLFYLHISTTLINFGFVPNAYDICVFNKVMHGKQCTITIHVDDLKISCADPRGVEDVIQELTRVYKKVNVYDDKLIDYLGMIFDYSEAGVVKISMQKMISKLLGEVEVDGTVKTPAAHNLFQVSEGGVVLQGKVAERFHSAVATLLYIAKRGRPDILTAVSFLTTRVQAPTQEDYNKLMRCLKYLNGTQNWC